MFVMYVQHIIHIMHKWYIGHQRLEDQTLSGRNRCLTPSHSKTQPPNLVLLDRQTCALSFFYLWVDCSQDKKACILLVDCNQDSKSCKIHFIKLVFISIQSMTMKHFDHVFCILFFFLFFCIKNKWRLHTTYPKREVPLQAPESLF